MPGRPKDDDAPQAHERVDVAEDSTPQTVERRAARATGYTTGSSGAGPHKAKAGQAARRSDCMPLTGISPSRPHLERRSQGGDSVLFGSPLKSSHDDIFRFPPTHSLLVRARLNFSSFGRFSLMSRGASIVDKCANSRGGTLFELEKAGAGVARFSS